MKISGLHGFGNVMELVLSIMISMSGTRRSKS